MYTDVLIKDVDGGLLSVEAPNAWRVVFDKKKGCLCNYTYGNYDYVKEPMIPNFWRAPTDNDKGGT